MRTFVLGQWEGLSEFPMDLYLRGDHIVIQLDGPDGVAFATMAPPQARALADKLNSLAARAETRHNSVKWEDTPDDSADDR